MEIMIVITWYIASKWAARFILLFLGGKILNGLKKKGQAEINRFKEQFNSKNDNERDMEN